MQKPKNMTRNVVNSLKSEACFPLTKKYGISTQFPHGLHANK